MSIDSQKERTDSSYDHDSRKDDSADERFCEELYQNYAADPEKEHFSSEEEVLKEFGIDI